MTLLHWKPEYSLDNPAIDREHREMIELINACHEQLGSDEGSDAIEAFLGDIYTNIAAHFALEEQIMRKADYGEFEAHKEDHEDLLDRIRDMMDVYQADPAIGKFLLQKDLGNWFSRHFSTFDARLHSHLPHQH